MGENKFKIVKHTKIVPLRLRRMMIFRVDCLGVHFMCEKVLTLRKQTPKTKQTVTVKQQINPMFFFLSPNSNNFLIKTGFNQ